MSLVRIGLSVARRHRIAILASYLSTLLVVLPIAISFGAIVHRRVGWSLLSGSFASGLRPALFLELVRAEQSALFVLVFVLLCMLGVFAIFSTAVRAGALASIAADDPSARGFSTAAGRWFGPLARLAPLGWLTTLVLGGAPAWAAFSISGWISEDWRSAAAKFWIRIAALSFSIVGACWAAGAHDRMRIHVICRNRGVLAGWVRGITDAIFRPIQTIRALLPFVLGAITLTLVALLVDVRIVRSTTAWIVVGALLQQIAALGRATLAIARSGAEIAAFSRSP